MSPSVLGTGLLYYGMLAIFRRIGTDPIILLITTTSGIIGIQTNNSSIRRLKEFAFIAGEGGCQAKDSEGNLKGARRKHDCKSQDSQGYAYMPILILLHVDLIIYHVVRCLQVMIHLVTTSALSI